MNCKPVAVMARTMAAGRIIDIMTGGKFDWRERLEDSDFLESADWLTALAYADAALSPQTLPAPGEVEKRCPASPDHADIKETIEDAADDWQAKGYTSALAEVRDMAAVGRSLMEALPKGYCYMDSPAEIISDLQNDLDEALATVAAANDEEVAEQAVSICDSDRCLAVFGAPEWAELSDDGKQWVVALVKETVSRLHKQEGKSHG